MNPPPADPDAYDLQRLAARLIGGWRLVLGLALAAALLALALAALAPDRYRAEALLAVARPASVTFDERFSEPEASTVLPTRAGSLRTDPELARSDAVALAVREALPEQIDPDIALEALRRRVTVRALAEGTLIGIEASGASPADAAALANAWAEALAARADALYGSGEDRAAVLAAREAAGDDLTAAAEALAQYDERGRLERLQAEVESLRAALAAELAATERGRRLEADLVGLREQVAAGGAPGMAIALARLQLAALSAPGSGAGSAAGAGAAAESIELSLPAGAFEAAVTPAELDALSAGVRAALRQLSNDATQTNDLLARTLAAQTRARAIRSALERAHGLADERYLTLARKADELDLAAAATRPELRLASPAQPSGRLPWGDWLRRALAAALLGAAAGIGWLLWRPGARI